jgi:hypothetical protein
MLQITQSFLKRRIIQGDYCGHSMKSFYLVGIDHQFFPVLKNNLTKKSDLSSKYRFSDFLSNTGNGPAPALINNPNGLLSAFC